jgi:hypothetical protein
MTAREAFLLNHGFRAVVVFNVRPSDMIVISPFRLAMATIFGLVAAAMAGLEFSP